MLEIRDIGSSLKPSTDKVTGATDPLGHEYHIMYGLFLVPVLQLANRNRARTKLLEIGLGCHMGYGAGASVRLWRTLLPETELWEADIDAQCIRHHNQSLLEQGVHTLTGPQGNASTLAQWIHISGGDFDAIIDDGSHQSRDILTTFRHLWPHLKPGSCQRLGLGLPKRQVASAHVASRELTPGMRHPHPQAALTSSRTCRSAGPESLRRRMVTRWSPM